MKYSRLEKPFNLKTAEISQFLIGTHLLPLPPFDRNSYPSSPRIYIYICKTRYECRGRKYICVQRTSVRERIVDVGRGRNTAVSFRLRKTGRAFIEDPEMLSGDVEERKLRRGYNVILHFVFRLNIILFSRNRRRAVSSILASPRHSNSSNVC